MIRLIIAEFAKLRRSSMVVVGFLGMMVPPFMTFLMILERRRNDLTFEDSYFDAFFTQTHLFITLVFSVLIFGLLATYLVHREYQEKTLKTMIALPVGRLPFLGAKFLVLFVWIEVLMMSSFAAGLVFAALGRFEGYSAAAALGYAGLYLQTGFWLFLLTPIVVFIALVFKNYVPAIGFSIVVLLGCVMILNSKYAMLFPWLIPFLLTGPGVEYTYEYPKILSYVILIGTALSGAAASAVSFKRSDIV